MTITPTELERLTIFTAAELARRYRSQGIRLSHPEALALISDEILTAARKGMQHADLVEYGRSLLTADEVEPGGAHMIPHLCVEACMAEGTRPVTVIDPIKAGHTAHAAEATDPGTIPGEIGSKAGCERVSVDVLNSGDRSIHVRSLSHFFEVNRALKFDRAATFGMRLDGSSGTGMRFQPGKITRVDLVPIEGTSNPRISGGHAHRSIRSGEVRQRGLRLGKGRSQHGV